MKVLQVRFAGGDIGPWRIDRLEAVLGDPLPPAPRLAVLDGPEGSPPIGATWILHGVTSSERYVNRAERAALTARQQGLGRAEATCAPLIPIRKSEAWWELTQDERREIFEERSRHIATGLEYLPAVARRLHHSHDLGQPFDFLTWFEFAPDHARVFEELVARLRRTAEWTYVEREVDIRLVRAPGG
jgi:chlorite dismutase